MKTRLGLVRFIESLRSSRWIVFFLALLTIVFVRVQLGWRSDEVWLVVGILLVWITGCWIWGNFSRRPDSLTSLSILDERGAWKDQFSSAWAFLTGQNKRKEASLGEALHLMRATGQLPEALTRLKQLIPLPAVRWLWLLPLLAIAFSIAPLLRPGIASGDRLLTKEMQDAAADQGDQLKSENERVKNLESLSKEEKKELEKLRSEVDAVAEDLATADGKSAMDVLEALESRARAAERLARKLGAESDEWASAAMLEEMGHHPDTADLALAIKGKKADPVAKEADKIAAILKQQTITRETENRITASLEQTMGKATEDDLKKEVGERFGNASRKMLDAQTATAAREFEELAKHFRTVRDREIARKKLDELAEKLRDAGSEIAGSKLMKMKKLTSPGQGKKKSSPQGLKSLAANPLANKIQNLSAPQTPMPGQSGAKPKLGKNKGQQAPVPGSLPKPKDGAQKKNGGLQAPVPGQGKQDGAMGMGKQDGKKEGKGQGKGGKLSAPIPGEPPPGGNTSPGDGSSSDGEAVASNGAQGGNEAGRGTAALVDNKTEAIKVTKNSRVAAQINKSGESTTRAVEGKVRSEAAERSRQEIMADFIAVEEQALDSKTLPISRRAHVLRYFSEIRNQFEKESKK